MPRHRLDVRTLEDGGRYLRNGYLAMLDHAGPAFGALLTAVAHSQGPAQA